MPSGDAILVTKNEKMHLSSLSEDHVPWFLITHSLNLPSFMKTLDTFVPDIVNIKINIIIMIVVIMQIITQHHLKIVLPSSFVPLNNSSFPPSIPYKAAR